MRDKTDRLITLNKIEVFVGIVVGIVSVAGVLAGYWILPYRVNAAEMNAVKLEARIEAVEKSQALNRELLVRIDERLRSVQERLHIPDLDKK